MSDIESKLRSLEALREQVVLRSRWPDQEQTLTLHEALREAGESTRAEEHAQALHGARAHLEFLQRPILAVLGELNAGKSSVVASFLSPAGQRRVPRGEASQTGTHRFVYWVPTSWLADDAIRSGFLELLSAAHGNQREYLAQDPQEAAEQYRSGKDRLDQIRVPLIADDPALDELGAAFLDCPDVQTRDEDESEPATRDDNLRLRFVGQAARICSAFLLVWERGKVRDRLLATLLREIRDRMSGAPLYLLLNKMEPQAGQPTRTRNDADVTELLEKFQLGDNHCYGAFHFRMIAHGDQPGWEDLTPPALVQRHRESDGQFPQFFALAKDSAENEAAQIADDRFLIHLPKQLDLAELQQQKRADNWSSLLSSTGENLDRVQQWARDEAELARAMHTGLLEFCARKFTDERTGEPLQVVTPDFTRALKESFVRTAPAVVRWSLALSKPFDRALEKAGEAFQTIRSKVTQVVSFKLFKTTAEEQGIARVEFANPQILAHEMHSLRWVPETVDEECLSSAWKESIDNLYRFPLELDEEQLDAMSREVWRDFSLWQKFKVASAGVLKTLGSVLALAGVITVAIDGGATILATYSLAATLSSGIPGMAAAGVAAAGGMGALAGLRLGAMNLNTLPYLSRLFSFSCDAFGVPRKLDDRPMLVRFGKDRGEAVPLPDCQIARQRTVCPLRPVRLWVPQPAIASYEKVIRHG